MRYAFEPHITKVVMYAYSSSVFQDIVYALSKRKLIAIATQTTLLRQEKKFKEKITW